MSTSRLTVLAFAASFLACVFAASRAPAQPTALPDEIAHRPRSFGERLDRVVGGMSSALSPPLEGRAAEGDVGFAEIRITFPFPFNPTQRSTFSYYTEDITAQASDNDYVPLNEFVTSPGSYAVLITIQVRGDSIREPDEQFKLTLVHSIHGTFEAIGTITNDDPLPRVSIDGAALAEGADGEFPIAAVPVRLDRPSAYPVVIRYATRNGSATMEDGDYLGAVDEVVLPPLSREGVLPVVIVGDDLQEPPEQFEVVMTQATDAVIAPPAWAQVTILADDVGDPPTVTVTRPNGGETFYTGTQEEVSWTSPPGMTVEVLISRQGGPWQTLGSDLYDVGVAYWKVEGPTGNRMLMKVQVTDWLGRTAEDTSDTTFRIVNLFPITAPPGEAPVASRPGVAVLRLAPNPSPGAVRIALELPMEEDVRMAVLDLQGREVARIAERRLGAGVHAFRWDGLGRDGPAPSGIYFLRWQAGTMTRSQRFVLAR